MPLEPGTHGIVSVEPLRVREEHAAGDWSCSICGLMHPVRSTWVLTYRPDEGPDLRFILCPECGEARTPLLVVLDLEHLAAEDDLEDVTEQVREVARSRAGASDRYIPIRDADLRELAGRRAMDVRTFVEELEERGVLRRRASSG